MYEIKDFKIKLVYSKLVQRALFSYLYEGIYKPLFEIIGIKPTAQNDINVIIDALNNNKIVYVEKGFLSLSGKFSNTLAKELEKIGAKYDKWERVYKLDKNKLPDSLRVAIANSQRLAQDKIKLIDDFLRECEANLNDMVESMIFTKEYETIIDDATGEMRKHVKKQIHTLNYLNEKKLKELSERNKQLSLFEIEEAKKKIDIGKLDLTDEDIEAVTTLPRRQVRDIAENYTNNMRYYIKGWAEKRIPEMRRQVAIAVLMGYREDYVAKMLQKEYKIAFDKAKFLAQNETSIMLSHLKKNIYKEMGFTHFRWNAILDAKLREEHYLLHNEVFAFDNPPIIYGSLEKGNAQYGLPGETYNCRCSFNPVSMK